MSGALCTRITIKGDADILNKFLHEIGEKVKFTTLSLLPNEATIETYQFKNIEYVDVLSETFRELEFYETVYDLHNDPGHWYLQTTMSKNGDVYHCHRWESPNNPKLYRKNDTKKLEVAFQYMMENLLKNPLPKSN